MKKMLMFFIFLFATITTMAQTDVVIDPTIFDSIYNLITGYVPTKTLTTILMVVFILENILPHIKWTPANSTGQLIWAGFKKVIHFLSLKKKQ